MPKAKIKGFIANMGSKLIVLLKNEIINGANGDSIFIILRLLIRIIFKK